MLPRHSWSKRKYIISFLLITTSQDVSFDGIYHTMTILYCRQNVHVTLLRNANLLFFTTLVLWFLPMYICHSGLIFVQGLHFLLWIANIWETFVGKIIRLVIYPCVILLNIFLFGRLIIVASASLYFTSSYP